MATLELDLIRDGATYSLSDGTISYLMGDDGWGHAPLTRHSERGPQQHGDSDKGYLLDPRVASLALRQVAESPDALDELRDTLVGLFAPTGTLALRWTRGSRVRQIDVKLLEGLNMASEERGGWASQLTGVLLKANDPTFYDPAGESVLFALGGGSDALTIPHSVPMFVGASVIDATTVVNNQGNWQALPHLIRITGPLTDPVIINETTGEVLDFTGVSIADSAHGIDIDLRYGYKTVVDFDGLNAIQYLSSGSDLATWHLEPGANSIRVTGTAATMASQVEIAFYERYLAR